MITIYTKHGCQPCRMTKLMFDRAGINYVEQNVDENAEARQAAEATGYKSMPIVDAGEHGTWAGLRPDLIQNLTNTKKEQD